MQVIVVGAREVSTKLGALPGEILRGTESATTKTVDRAAQAIAGLTPRRTGALAGSERTSVTATSTGARGKVLSDLRYATFVERGTAKHGAGQHMFERGSEQASSAAEGIYGAAMDEVARAFG